MATFDQRTALPASVTVVFPRQDDGAPSGDPTAYTVTLASLGLATVPAPPPTFTGTKVLWSSAVAYWEGGGSATNAAELQTLAERMASDWYSWRLAPYDLTYQGWVPWACDGAHDVILDHTTERQQTRVVRGPWLEHIEHSLHSGTYGSSPPGGSNNHYNTTINYGGNTTINYGPNTTNHYYGPVYYPHYTYNQFTTNVNNFNLTAGNVRVRVTTDEHFREIQSIVPGTNPSGRIICIHNVGNYVILLPNNSGAGANSILTATGNVYWLAPGHEVTLVYDGTSSRWRVSESSDERLGGIEDYGSLTDQDDFILEIDKEQHYFEPSTDGVRITGFAHGKAGLRHRLINGSATNSFILVHDSTDSVLANRIILPDSTDLTVPPGGEVEIDYGSDGYWRALGICCGDGGGEPAPEQDLFSTIAVDGQDSIIADDPNDTLTIVAGDNITITTDADTDTLTINAADFGTGDPPAYVPRWVKITKTFTDFATAATVNEIVLYTLPAGAMLHAAAVKHTASFTGGGIYAYAVSAGLPGGIPGDDTNALTTFDVFQAPGGSTFHYVDGTDSVPPFPLFMESFGSTFDLKAYAACGGAYLHAATTGSVDFYLLISELSGAPDEFGGGGGPFVDPKRFTVVATNAGASTATADSPASIINIEGTGGITVSVSQSGDDADVVIGFSGSVPYTPADVTDWAGGTDPGDVDDALDQLADRVDSIEGFSYVTALDDLSDVVIVGPAAGEVLTYNGSGWVNAPAPSAPVDSVNGLTGVVVLDPDDLDDTSTTHKFVTAAEKTKLSNLSGTNTGDQLVFKTISVSGQSDVVADTAADALTLVAGTGITITTNAGTDSITITCSVTGVSDGDKGDITVSGSGATWTIDAGVVTYAKMQDISTTARVLGRKTSGAGDTEECTLSEILDFIGSAAQGDILYRAASSWARLGAGTSGQALTTKGASANPQWTDLVPPGTVSMWAGNGSTPGGWILCDGSAVNRTTYAALYSAIGTSFGSGDGSTTFNVPNFGGRSPVGSGSSSGTSSRTLAGTGGAETHTLATSEMPAHTHGPSTGAQIWERNFGGGLDVDLSFVAGGKDGAKSTTGSTGGGGSHNNMHPWLCVHFIIKF